MDLLTVIIPVILSLATDAIPATEVNIYTRVVLSYPGTTLLQLQDALARGLRCGVLTQCSNDLLPPTIVYEVNYDMRRLKAGNEKYYAILDPGSLVATTCTCFDPCLC